MPQSFSDLTSSLTNHSIKNVYGSKHKNHLHKHKLRHSQSRPRSSSSSSSSSSVSYPSLSSSSASIDTATTVNEINPPHSMVGGPPSHHQMELVRDAWEKICELRHEKDSPSVSPAHAFGLLFYKALFELDPTLKSKLSNVIQQARVLADIMSYLARSPSAKGEMATSNEFKLRKSVNKKKISSSSMHSITITLHEENDTPEDVAYVDLPERRDSLSKGLKNASLPPHTSPSPPPPIYHRRRPSTTAIEKHYSDDVCPFYQQEQEEKYQQQLLLQQQQQEQQERQRSSIQKDRHDQLQRKLALQHQEDNHWFAYKLREVGVQYVEEYDLGPENLDAFVPALNSALKSRLHDELTPVVEQAWNQSAKFTFHHLKTGVEAHVGYHRRARRLSSGSYCSIEAGETNGACTIQ